MKDQEEKYLNPEESLRLIRETIDLAKNKVRDNGFHFLLWGWLVVGASLVNYYLMTKGYDYQKANMAWIVMPLIGVPVALFYEWRREKRRTGANIVSKWYGLVWLGFAFALILNIILSVRSQISPIPLILIQAGFATFLSGILLRFNILVMGGAVLWAGAALCIFLPVEAHTLVQAGAVGLGYIIPGYMLNAKARRSHE